MAHHKLLLDDDLSEEYALIAIHCSEEAYKMAFMLNQKLSLQLKRRNVDLEFSNEGLEVTFPIFKFEDTPRYIEYYLVSNTCKSISAILQPSGGLFDIEQNSETITTHLLPEFKNVDFFLKIDAESGRLGIRNILASINELNQVISAYEIKPETVKSKNNLIFS